MGKPNGHAPDPIDAAIAAADQPVQPTMAQVPVTLGTTGRQVVLMVPVDLQPVELMDLVAWMANPTAGLFTLLAQRRGPQLVVPSPGSALGRPT